MTPKQERFVEEYLVDLNATQALIRAGYQARGNAAEVNAARLLRNAQVAQAIQAKRAEISERTGRTVAQVMADLRTLGLKAQREVVDQHGNATMENPGVAAKCLELEAKHLGAFVERVEHSGNLPLSLTVTFEKPKGSADDQ